jgi:hypothetical protein
MLVRRLTPRAKPATACTGIPIKANSLDLSAAIEATRMHGVCLLTSEGVRENEHFKAVVDPSGRCAARCLVKAKLICNNLRMEGGAPLAWSHCF